tara:strand:+ start:840 stop:1328 length:489 start_codon:yes stop_codon:yes gene_type:complete
MNFQRFLRFVCYDNELSWLHHHSIWFSSILINILILFADNTAGPARNILTLTSAMTSVYPTVSYYTQFSGINMPSTVKNYCDPPFYTIYWGSVSYYGLGDIIGKNSIGAVNVVYLLGYSFLSIFFVIRHFAIITHPDEYNRYLEKCEHYKKPTIEFGEVVIS